MTMLVRDEERLLEANIRYHLSRGVDFIIATDNRSVDDTPDILRRYERHGILEYIYEEADDYAQDRWVSRMAKRAVEYGADWVFHVDADEFWWPEKGHDLKAPLCGVDGAVDGLKVRRSNFVYLGDNLDTPCYMQQIYRERESLNSLREPLPPKVCHRGAEDVQISQGNHSFTRKSGEPCTQWSDSLLVLHYPIHSSTQFKNKIQVGGSAYARNDRLRRSAGRTWTKLYYEHQADPSALDRYLERSTYSPTDIERGSDAGNLIEDVRLRDYLLRLF